MACVAGTRKAARNPQDGLGGLAMVPWLGLISGRRWRWASWSAWRAARGLLVFMRRVPLPSEGLYLLRVLAGRWLAAQPQG